MSVYIWTLCHADGSAVLFGSKPPKAKDDGCYWLGPHERFQPDGSVAHVGTRTTRYPADVWTAEIARVSWA